MINSSFSATISSTGRLPIEPAAPDRILDQLPLQDTVAPEPSCRPRARNHSVQSPFMNHSWFDRLQERAQQPALHILQISVSFVEFVDFVTQLAQELGPFDGALNHQQEL